MLVENGVGELLNVFEMNGLDNFEKVIFEKFFEGVNFFDLLILQLIIVFWILVLILDNIVCYCFLLFCLVIFFFLDGEVFLFQCFKMLCFVQIVVVVLYDEGAVIVVYVILVNCSFMFERLFNIYGK